MVKGICFIMKDSDFDFLNNLRSDLIKSIIFDEKISVEVFFSMDLSDTDQLDLIYYALEYRRIHKIQGKTINKWILALAKHHSVNLKSIQFLISLKNKAVNNFLHKNNQVPVNIRDNLFKADVFLRILYVKQESDISKLRPFLMDKSIKVRQALLKNPKVSNHLDILTALSQDNHPEIAKNAIELMAIDDLEVRALCMSDGPLQFETNSDFL